MYYFGGMSYFGWFSMVLFWGLVIWLIIWLINQNKERPSERKNPLEIISERYAKGELSKKEYNNMKKELSKTKR